MEIYIIIIIIVLAFICGYLDSSLGMGYGTILAPVLLILGFEPLLVIPSILLSETFTGLSAAIFHSNMKNCDFTIKEKNAKIVIIISSLGIFATIMSVIVTTHLPKIIIYSYIGLLVIIMGVILIIRKKFNFSWKKIQLIGILSAFNKSISGGGFGPVVTTGQIVSGRGVKDSIGVTTACEAPICIVGFFTYYLLSGFSDFTLAAFLCIGGIFATPIGAFGTTKIKNETIARRAIGLLVIILGSFMLITLIFSNFA